MVLLLTKVLKVIRVSKDAKVDMVSKDAKDAKDLLVLPLTKVLQDHKVMLVLLD